MEDVPVFCNVLYDTELQARDASTARMDLAQCIECGLLVNTAFDPGVAEYAPGYENSLHHSVVFQDWARTCAQRLVGTHRLGGGTALEIGCGRGGFLALLAEAGMSRVIGYDPSLPEGERDLTVDPVVEIHRGFYEPSGDVRVDLALSRHVLEHVTDPAAIVDLLAGSAPDGVLYLEVPDATTMLNETGIYDLIYEHCTYFGAPALLALVNRCGLEVLDVRTTFGGQYLSVEAAVTGRGVAGAGVAAQPSTVSLEDVLAATDGFAKRAERERTSWAEQLARFGADDKDVVVWGAGSKGVSFVNLIEGGGGVSRLVDLNPLKQGCFVPVTAQRVVGPQALCEDPPAAVIVMNPMYREEVSETVAGLGIHAEVMVA